ncbi:MAG TPA: pseudouridine synthase [Candidatus Saccharimonadales bacterium]
MRVNRFIAAATGMSRRAADHVIQEGRVLINGQPPDIGQNVTDDDSVTLDQVPLRRAIHQTILLHKPRGYVCSRQGQGSKTIYDLLPQRFHHLKPVGRLDKDSSGLILLTNDGHLTQQLTHPSFQKNKRYEVTLDRPLQPLHRQMISDFGLQLSDGLSKLQLERQHEGDDTVWIVVMHEGRNRQIRRTFDAVGYTVTRLHRTHFGTFALDDLMTGKYRTVATDNF